MISSIQFLLFINLTTFDFHSTYHLYADDLLLCSQTGVDLLLVSIEEVNWDLSKRGLKDLTWMQLSAKTYYLGVQ